MSSFPNFNCAPEVKDGFSRVCNEKYVFGTTWEHSSLVTHQSSCPLATLPHRYFRLDLALPMRKSWPHAHLVDNILQRIRETGLMDKIYFDNFHKSILNDHERWWPEVDFYKIAWPFLILSFGMLSAFVILSIEIIMYIKCN